jgi:hypothetical protein
MVNADTVRLQARKPGPHWLVAFLALSTLRWPARKV